MLMYCNPYVNAHGILLRDPLGLVSAHFTSSGLRKSHLHKTSLYYVILTLLLSVRQITFISEAAVPDEIVFSCTILYIVLFDIICQINDPIIW